MKALTKELNEVRELLQQQESRLLNLERNLRPQKRPLTRTGNPGDDCEAIFNSALPLLINGYYVVSSGLPSGTGPATMTVFCDFSQVPGQMTVDVAPPVHFEAVRDASGDVQTTTGLILTYDRLEFDTMPGYMNLGSGVFTAPVDGTYFFYYEGQTMDNVDNHFLEWRTNGQTVEQLQVDEESQNHKPFYSSITRELQKGDSFYIYMATGGINCRPNAYLFHYGGKLLY